MRRLLFQLGAYSTLPWGRTLKAQHSGPTYVTFLSRCAHILYMRHSVLLPLSSFLACIDIDWLLYYYIVVGDRELPRYLPYSVRFLLQLQTTPLFSLPIPKSPPTSTSTPSPPPPASKK